MSNLDSPKPDDIEASASCHCSDDFDDNEYDYEDQSCHTCGGEGWVDSVAEATGRWGWDDPRPGTCPNCKGSGLAKDCSTW